MKEMVDKLEKKIIIKSKECVIMQYGISYLQ